MSEVTTAMFKKRKGTSGIRGHLYETKLNSLILFRAVNDENIEEIYLASNMDEIGAFDDICFKVKLKDYTRPVCVFVQAKHRENTGYCTLNSKNNLGKYFDSYLKITQKFNPSNQDKIFNETFEDCDCVFVMYTTEKGDDCDVFTNGFSTQLNGLIATEDVGYRAAYTDEDVQYLSKIIIENEMRTLAEHLVKYLNDDVKVTMMSDECILRYHVWLAQKVLDISEINSDGCRTCTFKSDFYCATEKYLTIFKNKLYAEVIKNKKWDEDDKNKFLTLFICEPSDDTLKYLIGNLIEYKNGHFDFVTEMPKELTDEIKQITLPQFTVESAIKKGAQMILLGLKFTVPPSFGNKDLVIRGNEDKIEKRLKYLTSILADLMENSASKIITIDETLEEGLHKQNGGLASAIGNLLVYDDETTLIKFANNAELQNGNAKTLLTKLENTIENLHEYRFDVKVKKFPILTMGQTQEAIVKNFLDSLLFYTNQADENKVEKILKKEIEGQQTHHFRLKTDAIFLEFHDRIQRWWMSDKESPYLTKTCDMYEKALNNIIDKPLTTIISSMYLNTINVNEYKFNKNAIKFLEPLKNENVIIVTDKTMLTVNKLIQGLSINRYNVLDLHYVLKMPINEFNDLIAELSSIDDKDTLIIVWDNLQSIKALNVRLESFSCAIIERQTIIVTNKTLAETIKYHFPRIATVLHDVNSLSDLNQESYKNILKNTPVIFQGEEISLASLVDRESDKFITGAVFNDIMHKKSLVVGKPLGNPNYDEIKDLHIDRIVTRGTSVKNFEHLVLQTLHDIRHKTVLITAKPGMGKSTLLTHLSLETKKLNKDIWIVRVNLLEFSRQFDEWQNNKTVIDIHETLKFLCQVVTKNEINNLTVGLYENDGRIYLEQATADELTVFEIKMFLHYYYKRNIIFLFDGFDEICPHYVNEVVSFLNCIKNHKSNRKHRMWITSRSYNTIKSILQHNFGESYELDSFSVAEQYMYLDKFWSLKLQLSELNERQMNNVYDFFEFMFQMVTIAETKGEKLLKSLNLTLINVFSHLFGYLRNKMEDEGINDCNARHLVPTSSGPVSHYQLKEFRAKLENYMVQAFLFIGTPLHLLLLADYTVNDIKDINKSNWDLDIDTYTIFDRFIETKLKRILYHEKNKMDVCKPEIRMTYEKRRAEFIAMHKKLAAYAVLHKNGVKIFTFKELKSIKATIKAIKRGAEKSGLIYKVTNDIPQFVHMTFAEYFTIEYLSDILKGERNTERQKQVRDLIIKEFMYDSNNILRDIMAQKLKVDKELAKVIDKIEQSRPSGAGNQIMS